MINRFELFSRYNHPIAMTRCRMLFVMALCLSFCNLYAQHSTKTRFRVGATIAFGMSSIADNDVGVGGMAGAEKPFSKLFAGELEASFTYFTGDRMVYPGGGNKAWAIPVTAGLRLYSLSWLYGSVRAGAICFLLNHETSTHIRAAYGIAAGMNLPEKNNRLTLQLGYTGFRFDGKSRGYATLAAAIIIN
jgi:hypothetical protein